MILKQVELLVAGLQSGLQRAAEDAAVDQDEAEKMLLRLLRVSVKPFMPRAVFLAKCRQTMVKARQAGYYIRYLRAPATALDSRGPVIGAIVYRPQGDTVALGAAFCSLADRRRVSRHEAVHRAYEAQQSIDRSSWAVTGKRVLLEAQIPRSMRALVDTVLQQCWANADRMREQQAAQPVEVV